MDEYKVSKLDNDQFELFIPLMKDCFGLDVNLDYFDWKFNKNPSGFVEGFIAESTSGEIAAYYGVIPELFSVNGEFKIIYQSCDTMTHTRHRRKGLFQQLANTCYEYLRAKNKLFIYGFGGLDSTPGFLKFGWQHVFDVRYYFFPRIFSYFTRTDVLVIETINDLNKISNLLAKSNNKKDIHSIKNLDVYYWRISNPLHVYFTIAVKNRFNQYDAYLVYYEDKGKIVLFDFYYETLEYGKKIMNYLKVVLKISRNKGIITISQTDAEYAKRLQKVGFGSNPFCMGPLSLRIPFILYSENENMNSLIKAEIWEINSFEHDSL